MSNCLCVEEWVVVLTVAKYALQDREARTLLSYFESSFSYFR